MAPVYAILEGLVLGALSALFESRYPGIVLQAVFCTVGVFFTLLLAYRTGVIKATENFRLGVVAATGGIALVYLIDFAMNFFGMNVPFIHESGPMGIGISVVIVVVAALIWCWTLTSSNRVPSRARQSTGSGMPPLDSW